MARRSSLVCNGSSAIFHVQSSEIAVCKGACLLWLSELASGSCWIKNLDIPRFFEAFENNTSNTRGKGDFPYHCTVFAPTAAIPTIITRPLRPYLEVDWQTVQDQNTSQWYLQHSSKHLYLDWLSLAVDINIGLITKILTLQQVTKSNISLIGNSYYLAMLYHGIGECRSSWHSPIIPACASLSLLLIQAAFFPRLKFA